MNYFLTTLPSAIVYKMKFILNILFLPVMCYYEIIEKFFEALHFLTT